MNIESSQTSASTKESGDGCLLATSGRSRPGSARDSDAVGCTTSGRSRPGSVHEPDDLTVQALLLSSRAAKHYKVKRDGHFCDEKEREEIKKFHPDVKAEVGRLGRRKRKTANRRRKRVAQLDGQQKARFEALKASIRLCSRHSVVERSTDLYDS